MATRKLIERVTARVFCHGPGGGNPVTVFSSQQALSAASQERLAKECEWESVMVSANRPEITGKMTDKDNDDDNNRGALPELAFYMPSGEQVSFCAHAALGGACAAAPAVSGLDELQFSFQTALTRDVHSVQFSAEDPDQACLHMRAKWEESRVSHSPSLQRLVREHLGLASNHLVVKTARRPPTFVNSSIARSKTLVYVNTLEGLEEAKTPAVGDGKRTSFAKACGAIDDSSGIYLYAYRDNEDGAWECRQFPRSSGYPEDPATGIAAATLAASLYRQGIRLDTYRFYQGTKMGRPSLIQVQDLEMDGENMASFGLQGRVEIDEREEIEIED
jgi:predicted PhzF superfamily epimerase YddE/YHI9